MLAIVRSLLWIYVGGHVRALEYTVASSISSDGVVDLTTRQQKLFRAKLGFASLLPPPAYLRPSPMPLGFAHANIIVMEHAISPLAHWLDGGADSGRPQGSMDVKPDEARLFPEAAQPRVLDVNIQPPNEAIEKSFL